MIKNLKLIVCVIIASYFLWNPWKTTYLILQSAKSFILAGMTTSSYSLKVRINLMTDA